MSWTVRTGLHLVGIPGDATNPAPTLTELQDVTKIPPVGAMRKRMTTANAPFATYASHMADVVAAGFYPIPYLEVAFGMASGSPTTPGTWKYFVTQWVTAMRAVGVETFEVGNEVEAANGGAYWSKLRDASPIIRSLGGRVLLSSAGTGWGAAGSETNYYKMLEAAHAAGVYPLVDGAAVHIYAGSEGQGTAQDSLDKLVKARSTLDGFGGYAASLDIWVTEFGWATGPTGDPHDLTEASQRDRLTNAYNLIMPTAAANKLRVLVWFAQRDYGDQSSWPECEGLTGPYPGLVQKLSFARMVNQGAGTVDANVPTVTTGAADQTGNTTATVHGTVDPNGLPARYHVQFGNTDGYGSVSAIAGPVSGTSPVAVTVNLLGLAPGAWHYRLVATNDAGTSYGPDQQVTLTAVGGSPSGITEPISGLIPGGTVHYRIVATNADGTTAGGDQRFTATSPPTSTDADLARVTTISTLLSVEITTVDGKAYPWTVDAADPWNCPLEITFATQMGDGFAEGSCVVPRPIDIDFADLNLLDRVRLIGADGEVAYEGRVAGLPRSVDPDGEWIEVQFQGLMATARDRPFVDVIVDRTGERWGQPSIALREALMTTGTPANGVALDADYSSTVGDGSIHFKGSNQKPIPQGSQTNLVYRAPDGVKLAAFQFLGTERNVTTNEDAAILYATDDDSVVMSGWPEVKVLTLDGALRTANVNAPRKMFGLRLACNTTHTPPDPAHRHFKRIAVRSDHGIRMVANGQEPDGVYASDVMAYLIEKYCPYLDATGIEQSNEIIEQLVWDTPTHPFDAFIELNNYHQWNLGAWEDGRVEFAPPDLTTADYQVRSDEAGVTMDLQGTTIDSLANGMVVSYTDVDDGPRILWPGDHEELRDPNPNNPANQKGIELWTTLELPAATFRGALGIGREALVEFNRPKAPGTVTVSLGYVEDAWGNLVPGHKVRSGRTLSIANLPNDLPRRIMATEWTEEGDLEITLEQPGSRVDAAIARLELRQSLVRGG